MIEQVRRKDLMKEESWGRTRRIRTSTEGEEDTVSYTPTSICWLPTMCVLEDRRRRDENMYTVGSLLSIPSVLGG